MHKLAISTLAAVVFAHPILAQTASKPLPRSTLEERAWILKAVPDLEANPLGPKAPEERTHMLMLLMERSDIPVSACMTLLADIPKGDKDNYPILIEVLYSSAFYAVRHNATNPDSLDQYVAGVEGALRVYESLLRSRPADRNPKLDAVVQLRAAGKLRDYVAQRATTCK